jgi:hypothetical protein
MYHHFETKIRQITQTHWVRLLDVQIDADMQGVDCSLFVLGTLIRFDEHSALRCFSSNNLSMALMEGTFFCTNITGFFHP